MGLDEENTLTSIDNTEITNKESVSIDSKDIDSDSLLNVMKDVKSKMIVMKSKLYDGVQELNRLKNSEETARRAQEEMETKYSSLEKEIIVPAHAKIDSLERK